MAKPRQTRKSPATRSPREAPPAPPPPPRVLYLLSDSTGNLARHMLTAFLTQFPADTFTVRTRLFLDRPEKLTAALDETAREPGIVLHALVARTAKSAVEKHCTLLKLPCKDLTGDFVEFLSKTSGVPAGEHPNRLHHVDEAYLRRIKALEFSMSHDDGLGLETLHEADLVLTGVSRTSKTPTTIYLAQQGWKVGNVALAIQVEPPKELLALPPQRVVGLVIDPHTLTEIRTRRQHDEWHMGDTRYNDLDAVEREIAWSKRLFAQRGWPVLDVTNRAIEESAARILQLAQLGAHPPT